MQPMIRSHSRVASKIRALALGASVLVFGSNQLAHAKIIKFDPSGSVGTDPTGINDKGWVAGGYVDANGRPHGFLRIPSGRITTFDVPRDNCGTDPWSINRKGATTGDFGDRHCNFHGFLRAGNGHITTFDVPQVHCNGSTKHQQRRRDHWRLQCLQQWVPRVAWLFAQCGWLDNEVRSRKNRFKPSRKALTSQA